MARLADGDRGSDRQCAVLGAAIQEAARLRRPHRINRATVQGDDSHTQNDSDSHGGMVIHGLRPLAFVSPTKGTPS
jgi:hypothetical protein